MAARTIRIATRKSDLAMWQAHHVAALLAEQPDVDSVELVPMVTKGDRILDKTLNKIGGKGLFIKELEHAMLAGEADIAVHSMKDVPAEMPEGFTIACVLEREDPRDALVGSTLENLGQGAIVGTSSLRRVSQLLRLRPDLDIRPLRGNVNTRLAKLDSGEYDAIVLACAGLKRLGMAERITESIATNKMLPAVGQGIVGIECLTDNDTVAEVLARLQDSLSQQAITAERAVAKTLGATCHSPLGVHATLGGGDRIHLRALLTSADGSEAIDETLSGNVGDANRMGVALAERMLGQGAKKLIEQSG